MKNRTQMTQIGRIFGIAFNKILQIDFICVICVLFSFALLAASLFFPGAQALAAEVDGDMLPERIFLLEFADHRTLGG